MQTPSTQLEDAKTLSQHRLRLRVQQPLFLGDRFVAGLLELLDLGHDGREVVAFGLQFFVRGLELRRELRDFLPFGTYFFGHLMIDVHGVEPHAEALGGGGNALDDGDLCGDIVSVHSRDAWTLM